MPQIVSPHLLAKLGQRMRVQGQQALANAVPAAAGSTAGASAAGGATPGAPKPPSPSTFGGNGGGGGGGATKPKFNPMRVMRNLPTNKPLTPKQQFALARAEGVLETRPAIREFARIAKQEAQERDSTAAGLSNLGTRTAGNVSDVYKNIAESAAKSLAMQGQLGQQLNQQSGQIAATGNKELAGMQTGALGDLTSQLQMRGAPAGGGAQEALAQAVASQQATQNSDSQAAQQFAASQGANSAGLLAGMAGATQMQGGEAVAGIGRAITNRVAESNAKFNQTIQSAHEKQAEAKQNQGLDITKNLGAIREGEQKFQLGEQATHGEKAALTQKEREGQREHHHQEREAGTNERGADTAAGKLGLERWEAHHPSASSGEIAKQEKKTAEEIKNIKSLIPQAAAEAKKAESEGKKGVSTLPNYISYINSQGEAGSPALVRQVLKHWWEKKTARENQGGTHR
jgi:hypothetical protein